MPIKVLYVEDELFLGKIVKETLETRGFEVIMESDGADVIRTFEDENPDICILDVMLPNKSGFELAEDIRKVDSEVPIVFLTAKGMAQDKVKGFQVGGDDYITKPIVKGALEKALQEWLNLEPNLAPIAVVEEGVSSSNEKIHFNKEDLSHRLGNDTVFMSQLLEIADRQLQEFLVELHELFAKQNLNGIKSLAHKLKGTALSSGFD